MPDPRFVGLHELKSLIHHLNEANLRVTSAGAHLSQLKSAESVDLEELSSIKEVIEEDLLPRCIQVVEKLAGATFEN